MSYPLYPFEIEDDSILIQDQADNIVGTLRPFLNSRQDHFSYDVCYVIIAIYQVEKLGSEDYKLDEKKFREFLTWFATRLFETQKIKVEPFYEGTEYPYPFHYAEFLSDERIENAIETIAEYEKIGYEEAKLEFIKVAYIKWKVIGNSLKV